VSHVDVAPQANEAVELVAHLFSTSVNAPDLDDVVATLRRLPGARDVGWTRTSAH
jgi:hypothetical protein